MSFQHDRRVIVYPNYINSVKTVAEGRRIPKEQGCENPMVTEMADACKQLKLAVDIEDKHYSRDWCSATGRCRIRVALKNPDGTPANPEVPDRRTLLLKIAELVPKHVGRQGGKKPQGLQLPGVSAEPSSSTSKPTGKTNKKKKK